MSIASFKNQSNPIAKIRYEHAISQVDLAEYADITRQIVTDTEAGIFNKIPPALLSCLKDEYAIDPIELQAQYIEWIRAELNQINVREIMTVHRHGPSLTSVETAIPVGINSFREWRAMLCKSNGVVNYTSLAGFGKLIKVQPVTIRKYETGKTHSLPEPLVVRLTVWGFPTSYLAALASLPIGKALEAK